MKAYTFFYNKGFRNAALKPFFITFASIKPIGIFT